MQRDKYIVPGLYAEIKDYQLVSLETPQSLSENAIVLLGDLPDFVYVPDDTATNVDAVKKIRINPNTILPISSVSEAVRTLSGENILKGILTQEQKDELICKDMISAIKLASESASVGELAIVKIVKRDGTRPNTNNKFEVFQALENAYEKLGCVKCSQIVPIGISGDEDFITGEEKEAVMNIKQGIANGVVKQTTIYNDLYNFTPTRNIDGVKIEFVLEHQEYLNHEGETEQQQLVKAEGLASAKVKPLLTGKVLLNGTEKLKGLPLSFDTDKFVLDSEVKLTIAEGEAGIVIGQGTIFATVRVTENHGKVLPELTSEKQPLLNYYEGFEIKAEVASCNATPATCKVNEIVTVTGKLKESADAFTASMTGEGFEVTEAIALQSDKMTFIGKVKATAEGEKTLTVTATEPYVAFNKQFTINVTGAAAAASVRKKATKVDDRSVTKVFKAGSNQFVTVEVVKPTSKWLEIYNKGNLKEVVDKLAVLEGKKEGVEQYNVTTSGTYVVTFDERDGKYFAIVTDPSEEKEVVEKAITVKDSDGAKVISEMTYIKLSDMTLVLYPELVVVPKPTTYAERVSVYFDAKVDEIAESEYVINFVPVDAEIIKSSLTYIQQQISSLSETLMVWGVKPPVDAESNTVNRYINKLVNLPKFKKGFKVRTSASKEVDLGAFVSVVVGPIKINGIGGITNFVSHKVVDYERQNGGAGEVKPLTNKLFVELTDNFTQGTNVEIKTYVGVKQTVVEAIVLSTKEVMGKTMITLDKEIDTSIFSLTGFEVMISNTDAKDRHGSFAALAFAVKANKERDRSPLQQDLNGVADINFSRGNLETLLKNKFTVISKNLISGKGVIVDTPTMTRPDSDFQNRSAIGTLLVMLNKLRKVADTKKGKRFPKKEDKVMLEQELRNVFVDELQRPDSLITAYNFRADMRYLDNYGYLSAEFEVQDAKKLEKVKFTGGLARLNN